MYKKIITYTYIYILQRLLCIKFEFKNKRCSCCIFENIVNSYNTVRYPQI